MTIYQANFLSSYEGQKGETGEKGMRGPPGGSSSVTSNVTYVGPKGNLFQFKPLVETILLTKVAMHIVYSVKYLNRLELINHICN